jgi:hypothetical protein
MPQMIDKPNNRKLHKGAIPQSGGFAFPQICFFRRKHGDWIRQRISNVGIGVNLYRENFPGRNSFNLESFVEQKTENIMELINHFKERKKERKKENL